MKKHDYGFCACQNRLGKTEKEKKKVVVQINSYPTRNRKFPKNSKKILKFIKHYKGFSSSQNRLGMAKKERKQKLSLQSIPTQPVIENSKEIAKKL